MADLNLTVGGGHKFGGLRLTDAVTGNTISATFSNQTVVNNNPEFATIEVNQANPDSVSAVAITPGNGTIVVSAHADYTDAGDGQLHSQDFSVTKTFEVIGAPNGANFDVFFL